MDKKKIKMEAEAGNIPLPGPMIDIQQRQKDLKNFQKLEKELTEMIGDTGNQELMDKFLAWLDARNKLNEQFAGFMQRLTAKIPKQDG